jgi:hypothetical protein
MVRLPWLGIYRRIAESVGLHWKRLGALLDLDNQLRLKNVGRSHAGNGGYIPAGLIRPPEQELQSPQQQMAESFSIR